MACGRHQMVVKEVRRQLLVAALAGAALVTVVLAYPSGSISKDPATSPGPSGRLVSSSASGIISAGSNVFSTHTAAEGRWGISDPKVPMSTFSASDFSSPSPFRILCGEGIRPARSSRRRDVHLVPRIRAGRVMGPSSPALKHRRQTLRPARLPMYRAPARRLGRWMVDRRRADGGPEGHVARRRRFGRLASLVCTVLAFIPMVDTYSVPFRVTTAAVPGHGSSTRPDICRRYRVCSPYPSHSASRRAPWAGRPR